MICRIGMVAVPSGLLASSMTEILSEDARRERSKKNNNSPDRKAVLFC